MKNYSLDLAAQRSICQRGLERWKSKRLQSRGSYRSKDVPVYKSCPLQMFWLAFRLRKKTDEPLILR